MSDEKQKMTDDERMAASKKLARRHNRELDELRAAGATSNEIRETVARHEREQDRVLGELNQPCVGGRGRDYQRTV